MDIIFCPTIPATGTNFLIKFFETVTGCQQKSLPTFLKQRNQIETQLIHVHVFHDGTYLNETEYFCSQSHLVIPIRDPLAAVVRANSIPTNNFGKRCAKSFQTLKRLGEAYNAKYLPIDVLYTKPFEQRYEALLNLLPEVYKEKKEDVCKDWACRWPVHNARVYDLKALYLNRDVKGLSELKGWSTLIETESILRPWLEKLGYRNLSWWS